MIFYPVFHSWFERYIFAFTVALFLSLFLTGVSVFLLKKLNIMDWPGHRKIHTKPVPRMGGVAIYIAFIIPMIAIMYFDDTQKGIIIGSGIALLVGAVDDIWHVSAVIKLISLFTLTILIWRYGVVTSFPFHRIGLNSEIINLLITMLWLTGICSAVNALDHMDGLAGGVSLIAAFAYFAVSVQTGQFFWGLLSISLAGSLLGFLCFNRHPAKIFMGDSGSFFLGFSLASIGIMGGWSENPVKAAIIPTAVLSIPIFDLCYVIVSRVLNGTTNSIKDSITYCGKDHIGHRLCKLGLSQPVAVKMVFLISATVAISALVIRRADFLESMLLFIQIVMIYILLAIFLSFINKVVNLPDGTGKQ